MESRDVLKIHGALRRYCTSRVSLRSTLEVQYLLNLPCIFNTSLDSMLYLLNTITSNHNLCNYLLHYCLIINSICWLIAQLHKIAVVAQIF